MASAVASPPLVSNPLWHEAHLLALATYFYDYRNKMAHWRRTTPGTILDVRYADLVRQPEADLREASDFCGFEREPWCGDITRNGAPSATLSAAQVRVPLHARAFGKWRGCAEHLEPRRLALETT